jgi:O-methyltransferase
MLRAGRTDDEAERQLLRRMVAPLKGSDASPSMLGFIRSIPKTELIRLPKVKLILTVKRYTLLSYARLSALYEIGSWLERQRRGGAFVECGTWNGGSAAVLASAARRNSERHLWLFDSWQGMPEPTQEDVSYTGKPGVKGMTQSSEQTVRDLLFERLRLDPSRVHLGRGWFEETIPRARDAIGRIALLHVDCDWYESVRFCLETLYDQVVDGGFVVVDDYGHWKGCQKAVDEFRERRGITSDLIRVDYSGVFFRK